MATPISVKTEQTRNKIRVLKERQDKLAEQLKKEEALLEKYEDEFKIQAFSEAEDVFHAIGFSLAQILELTKSGKLSYLFENNAAEQTASET